MKQQKIYIRLLKLVAPFKWWILLAVFLGFATISSSIGLMATASYIIASAALHPQLGSLFVPITGARFFGISRGVFRYAERIVSHNTTFKLLARIRVWFYEKLEPLAPAKLQKYKSGDLMSRIIADVETLDHFYVNVVAPPLVAVAIAAGMFAFLWSFSIKLAVAFLIMFAIAAIVAPWFASCLSRGLGKKIVNTRSELNIALIDGIQGLADLIAFGQAEKHKIFIDRLNKKLSFTELKMAWISALNNGLQVLLANLALVVVLAVAIPLANDQLLKGVTLAVLAMGTLAAFEATQNLPTAFQYLEKTGQAAKRLFEIVDSRPDIVEPARSLQPQFFDISITNLTFSYPSSGTKVLDNISLLAPQGKKIAIVGPSGAGKSTIFNLLLRFWDYDQGSIKIGNVELKNINSEQVKEYYAVVTQNTYLFNSTIRENLLLAKPDATDDQIKTALEQAQIYDFIARLPQGLDTYIGDQGMNLSGGERQRLAIARALLKNAPILLLDEATANLDPITETEIMKTLLEIMQDKTTIMITHRLVGMEHMDQIYVLHEGKIIEKGKHYDLVKNNGIYAKMWHLQQEIFLMTQ